MIETITNIDWSILHWIQGHLRCGFLDKVMPVITYLGNYKLFTIWLVAALIMICTKRYRSPGVVLLIGIIAWHFVGNVILKNIFGRPRPFIADPSIQLLIQAPGGESFPSGHTGVSALAAAILMKTEKKFGWFAIPMAALIMFSRVYLEVHYPSDVLGGIVFGVLLGLLVWEIGRRTVMKHSRWGVDSAVKTDDNK